MPPFFKIFLNNFKEYIVLVFLLILSLALITLNDNHKVKNVRLFALGTFASVNSTILNLTNYFENTEYVEGLLKQNAKLMLQVNELRNYAYEFDEIKKQIDYKNNSKYDLISAKIISRLVSNVSGNLIISKGSEDGITENMPVITDQGLVGIIVDVAKNYSTVRTYQNSLFKVAVKDQRSNVDGILNWDGKDLIVKNVPTTEDVDVGDRIMVSELSTIIPPAIPVGIVSSKESTVSGLLSNIKIRSYQKLNEVRNVLVIQKAENFQLDSLSQKINGINK